jgi:hypothetical protein
VRNSATLAESAKLANSARSHDSDVTPDDHPRTPARATHAPTAIRALLVTAAMV